MHLITHGIPARCPDVKIINSHLSGALPMLLQRADDQYRWEAPDTPEGIRPTRHLPKSSATAATTSDGQPRESHSEGKQYRYFIDLSTELA